MTHCDEDLVEITTLGEFYLGTRRWLCVKCGAEVADLAMPLEAKVD